MRQSSGVRYQKISQSDAVPASPKKSARHGAVAPLGTSLFVCAILVAGGWTGLVLLYAPILPDGARLPVTLAISILVLLSVAGIFLRALRLAIVALGLGAVLATMGWARATPSHTGDWPPEVARLAQASIEGDRVTIRNIRNFTWHGIDQFVERWEAREYSLSSLNRLDLIASYWAGPHIAHLMLSFGFDTGEQLVASIEIRRRKNQEYSTLQGAFRNYELIYVLGDERDLLRLRTTFRKERVHLFRLRTPRDSVRRLFLEYLETINALANNPRFYNTLSTNCTTQIRVAGLAAGAVLPWDWRLLMTGHTPEYLYARGSPDTRLSFEELHRRSRINESADQVGDSALFSRAIREAVPDPLRE